ncbi:MAG: hypothetical protein NWR52_03240, partial [Paracoccaceae bacterium]|nr:hypothetical protein [Paracoccaceae bacterium]
SGHVPVQPKLTQKFPSCAAEFVLQKSKLRQGDQPDELFRRNFCFQEPYKKPDWLSDIPNYCATGGFSDEPIVKQDRFHTFKCLSLQFCFE